MRPLGILSLFSCLLLVAACDDGGEDSADSGTRCGSGVATVALGASNPFRPVEGDTWQIESGNQGGFHIDVSLRLQGSLDPDHADVELVLLDGEARLGRYFMADWLLSFAVEGFCDFPDARIVLLDSEGGLLELEDVIALDGRSFELRVGVDTPLGDARHTQMITLDWPE